MRPFVKSRGMAFVAVAAITACSLLAGAQPKKPGAAPHAAARPSAAEGGAPVATSGESGRDGGAGTKSAAAVEPKSAGGGDAGSRVFRFGEVEVEGRLKSPQIVYFLRRVRAEFAAGDLGHRSFIRELGETKNEQSF